FSSRRRHTRSKRDWSSDVCSSDLGFGGGGGGGPTGVGRNPPGGAVVFFYLKTAPDSATNVSLEILDSRDSLVRRFTPKPRAPSQIGRASCRERVWSEVGAERE